MKSLETSNAPQEMIIPSDHENEMSRQNSYRMPRLTSEKASMLRHQRSSSSPSSMLSSSSSSSFSPPSIKTKSMQTQTKQNSYRVPRSVSEQAFLLSQQSSSSPSSSMMLSLSPSPSSSSPPSMRSMTNHAQQGIRSKM